MALWRKKDLHFNFLNDFNHWISNMSRLQINQSDLLPENQDKRCDEIYKQCRYIPYYLLKFDAIKNEEEFDNINRICSFVEKYCEKIGQDYKIKTTAIEHFNTFIIPYIKEKINDIVIKIEFEKHNTRFELQVFIYRKNETPNTSEMIMNTNFYISQ